MRYCKFMAKMAAVPMILSLYWQTVLWTGFLPASILAFALTIIALSFRDSWREIRSFYDPAILRNFWRSSLRLQFSLRTFIIASLLLPPLAVAIWHAEELAWLRDGSMLPLVVVYLGVMVVPALIYMHNDLVGPPPRELWRKRRQDADGQ